jgi:hypothetical protein
MKNLSSMENFSIHILNFLLTILSSKIKIKLKKGLLNFILKQLSLFEKQKLLKFCLLSYFIVNFQHVLFIINITKNVFICNLSHYDDRKVRDPFFLNLKNIFAHTCAIFNNLIFKIVVTVKKIRITRVCHLADFIV